MALIRFLAATAACVCGLALVTIGVGLIYFPAALIVLGCALVAGALVVSL